MERQIFQKYLDMVFHMEKMLRQKVDVKQNVSEIWHQTLWEKHIFLCNTPTLVPARLFFPIEKASMFYRKVLFKTFV